MRTPMFLPRAKARKIHRSALGVLAKTGIYLDHEEAAELCLRAGARRDRDGRLLLPPQLVEKALAETPRGFEMFSRDGNPVLTMADGRTYFGPGSDALYNIDKKTGELRFSTLQDVADNVRLADALPGFDFVMSMALPEDVAPERLYPAVFAEMVKNTTKPLITTLTTVEDLRLIHRLASVVAGGDQALRCKPFFLTYLEPISPLRIERSIAERLLYCAEHELPFFFAAGANCGAGAPVTPEGAVVQGTAESLAGLALAWLKNPSLRFVFGANNSSIDMRSSIVSYGAPEWYKTVAMYADLGKFYGLPSWGTAGCSDAQTLDAQAAWEAGEGILLAVQSEATLNHDVGYLAAGTLYDARMLVLTSEMISRARQLMREPDLSPGSLAASVIDEVARGKSLYLAHPHTAANFRQALWLPPAWVRRRKIALEEPAGAPLNELLAAEVNRLLAEHRPAPLEAEKVSRINALLA